MLNAAGDTGAELAHRKKRVGFKDEVAASHAVSRAGWTEKEHTQGHPD